MKVMKAFLPCLCLILGLPNTSVARCVESASYLATVKVNKCKEDSPGEIFIKGELLSAFKWSRAGELLSPPVKGQVYLFYKGLSPLVRDWKGALQKRKIGYCKEIRGDSILQGILSRPCCDAGYAWCKRAVDFLIDESEGPTF